MEDASFGYLPGKFKLSKSKIKELIEILNLEKSEIKQLKRNKRKVANALKDGDTQIAKVIRDGETKEILAEELVVGDIIELSDGNYVPADCRIIEEFNLKIEESSLTGETEPVTKTNRVINKEDIPLGDMKNTAFMGSIVVSGRGKAIVTETGMNTKIGQIANMIIEDEAPETPIQKKLGEVGKILGIVCLAICVVIFLIGIIKKIEPVEMFMTSVGLAVAAIPEGLPAIVTIMLSIGVTKMAKKNSIIRKLPAVETLGSSSVICSDKTGTLTQNKMQVTKIANINGETNDKEYIKWLMGMATMCTDVEISKENGKMELTGEPTEKAIVSKALDEGQNKNELYNVMKRVKDIPFDSSRKMMTTIHKMPNGYRVITKGAPDVLLKRCNKVYDNGNVTTLDYSKTKLIENQNNKMADEALRVLAIAYLDIPNLPSKIDTETVEKNLIFIGLIGMIDPPREGVKEAVATCKKAGIKTVMITGDHIITAKAIAKELNILAPHDKAITGKELDQISQEQLVKEIKEYSVFARVTPEHKVRIVKAWQRAGNVVAMTGDGVNDSPALKCADIGIAMGKNGTDVAKNASDMILADDNFATIVKAVENGRNLYQNIKYAIQFLLSGNFGAILAVLCASLAGLPVPFAPVHLLFINLLTDSLPAIALGVEPHSSEVMNEKPRSADESILTKDFLGKIGLEGLVIGMMTMIGFLTGYHQNGALLGSTYAFGTLCLARLFHGFNCKSDHPVIFTKRFFNNKWLQGAFVLGAVLITVVLTVPGFHLLFKVETLDLMQLGCVYLYAFASLPIIQLLKWIRMKLRKRGEK